MFFVISGYLISSILLAELKGVGTLNLTAFYARRALRLLPGLLAVLVAHMLTFRLWLGLGAEPTDLVAAWAAGIAYYWNLLIVINGTLPQDASVGLAHLWSLAQEEQFYLAIPLLLLALAGTRRRTALFLALMTVASLVTALLYFRSAGSITSEFSPWTRSFGLFVGCTLAALRSSHRFQVSSVSAWLAVALLAIVVIACLGAAIPMYWDIPVGATAAGVVVAHLTCAPPVASSLRALLSRPFVVRLGVLSYSIYLWHLPLIVVARDVMNLRPAAVALFVIPVTLLLAVITRRYLEIPAARLKARLFGRPMAGMEQQHSLRAAEVPRRESQAGPQSTS